MDYAPISRSALQQLKAVTDEEKRQEDIKNIVKSLYHQVLNLAKSSNVTAYTVELYKTDPRAPVRKTMSVIPTSGYSNLNKSDMNLILDNQEEILQHLRELFPDCAVSIKTLSRGANGQYYDASTLDESALRFIDKRYDQTHLVVDWS